MIPENIRKVVLGNTQRHQVIYGVAESGRKFRKVIQFRMISQVLMSKQINCKESTSLKSLRIFCSLSIVKYLITLNKETIVCHYTVFVAYEDKRTLNYSSLTRTEFYLRFKTEE